MSNSFGRNDAFMQHTRQMVESQYPGIIEAAQLDDFKIMAIGLKIGSSSRLTVQSETEVQGPMHRRETLATTPDGEKIIFVKQDDMSRNVGTLYYVKPPVKPTDE